jgi:drug/metabolite transporter (DMT)-like permease
LLPLLLLCTGTLVVIANQVVSNQAAVSPQAQLLTLMRYLCTCGLSAILVVRERRSKAPTKPTSKAAAHKTAAAEPKPRVMLLVLLCVGLLDVGCYALYNIGFAWCGSALATIVLAASGQIATAVLSVLVLKRELRARHLAAVSIVTVGLVLRSMDDILAGSLTDAKSVDSSQSSKQTYGALLVVVSALLFSILGVIYEKRSENQERKLTQAQVGCKGMGQNVQQTPSPSAQSQWAPLLSSTTACQAESQPKF